MYTYTVDRLRNPEFFSVVRNDAVTCRPIRSGDTISICASCGAVHLKESWEANARHCAECDSTLFENLNDAYLKTLRVTATEVITRNPNNPNKLNVVTPVPHTPRRRAITAHPIQNNRSVSQTAVSSRRPMTVVTTPEAYPSQTASRNIGGRILLWGLGIAAAVSSVVLMALNM